jgi:hypothetical protein
VDRKNENGRRQKPYPKPHTREQVLISLRCDKDIQQQTTELDSRVCTLKREREGERERTRTGLALDGQRNPRVGGQQTHDLHVIQNAGAPYKRVILPATRQWRDRCWRCWREREGKRERDGGESERGRENVVETETEVDTETKIAIDYRNSDRLFVCVCVRMSE